MCHISQPSQKQFKSIPYFGSATTPSGQSGTGPSDAGVQTPQLLGMIEQSVPDGTHCWGGQIGFFHSIFHQYNGPSPTHHSNVLLVEIYSSTLKAKVRDMLIEAGPELLITTRAIQVFSPIVQECDLRVGV